MEPEKIILSCPSCRASFYIRAEALGPHGREVRCSKCGHQWHAVAEAPEPTEPEPEPEEEFAWKIEESAPEPDEDVFEEEVSAREIASGPDDSLLESGDDENFGITDSPAIVEHTVDEENDPFGTLARAFADRPADSDFEHGGAGAARRASADMFGAEPEREAASAYSIAEPAPVEDDQPELDKDDRSVPQDQQLYAAEEPAPSEPVQDQREEEEKQQEQEGEEEVPRSPAQEPRAMPTRPRIERRPSTTGRAIAASFVALCFVVAALIAAGLFMQPQIVGWLPAASRIYALAGLESDTLGYGLQILEPTPMKRVDSGDEVLVVAGEIRNTVDKAISVPLMRASLLDQEGRELRIWTFKADQTEIEPGQTVSYKTEFRNPPPTAAKLDITFTRPGEVEIANKPDQKRRSDDATQ